MGAIASSFTKTMEKAFTHFSKKFGCNPENIQVIIRAKDEKVTLQYLLMKDFKVIREVSFKEILDVKVDILGKEMVATPFLQDTLVSLSEKSGIKLTEASVVIYNTEKERGEAKLVLYNNNKLVRQLDLEEDIIG